MNKYDIKSIITEFYKNLFPVSEGINSDLKNSTKIRITISLDVNYIRKQNMYLYLYIKSSSITKTLVIDLIS